MQITKVTIDLVDRDPKLLAYADIVFDDSFIVFGIRLVKMTSGDILIAMPSRPINDHCPRCQRRNPIVAQYCNECGRKLEDGRAEKTDNGKTMAYHDVCHPVNNETRLMIRQVVLEAYDRELLVALEK